MVCDKHVSAYCEAFVVLPAQRVQAAIVGVRQKGRPNRNGTGSQLKTRSTGCLNYLQ